MLSIPLRQILPPFFSRAVLLHHRVQQQQKQSSPRCFYWSSSFTFACLKVHTDDNANRLWCSFGLVLHVLPRKVKVLPSVIRVRSRELWWMVMGWLTILLGSTTTTHYRYELVQLKVNDGNCLPHERRLHYLLECHIFSYTPIAMSSGRGWHGQFFCSEPKTGAM